MIGYSASTTAAISASESARGLGELSIEDSSISGGSAPRPFGASGRGVDRSDAGSARFFFGGARRLSSLAAGARPLLFSAREGWVNRR